MSMTLLQQGGMCLILTIGASHICKISGARPMREQSKLSLVQSAAMPQASIIVLCDTCERPYHLQCCFPPHSGVPDGPFHCHVCDEKFSNMDEFSRPDDPILFARRGDPHHHEHAVLLEEYVRRFEAGLHLFSESRSSPCSGALYDRCRRAAALFAEEVFTDCDNKSLK
jgi:hypothetical protein